MNYQVTGPTSETKIVALTGVMAALIAVLTAISIPVPPPVSAITLAPIAIFITSILLGPRVGFVSAAIGSGIGYIVGTSIGTISPFPGYYYIYLVGIIIARGPMGLAVGALRRINEIFAMVMGVAVETFIFTATDFYLFGIGIALGDLATFVDLSFIVPAVLILWGVRSAINTKYLT